MWRVCHEYNHHCRIRRYLLSFHAVVQLSHTLRVLRGEVIGCASDSVGMDMDESGELPDMPTFGQISTTSFNSRSSSPPPPRRRDTASSIMASSVWSKGGESYTEQYSRMTGSPGQDLSRYTEGPARYLNGAPNTGSKAMLEKTVLASPRGRWNPGNPLSIRISAPPLSSINDNGGLSGRGGGLPVPGVHFGFGALLSLIAWSSFFKRAVATSCFFVLLLSLRMVIFKLVHPKV